LIWGSETAKNSENTKKNYRPKNWFFVDTANRGAVKTLVDPKVKRGREEGGGERGKPTEYKHLLWGISDCVPFFRPKANPDV